jgi:histidinol-phosphate aminotransferase
LYEHLKTNGVLVRYMPYVGWGEGLRISVGSDDQIDVCLTLLAEALKQPPTPSEQPVKSV